MPSLTGLQLLRSRSLPHTAVYSLPPWEKYVLLLSNTYVQTYFSFWACVPACLTWLCLPTGRAWPLPEPRSEPSPRTMCSNLAQYRGGTEHKGTWLKPCHVQDNTEGRHSPAGITHKERAALAVVIKYNPTSAHRDAKGHIKSQRRQTPKFVLRSIHKL